MGKDKAQGQQKGRFRRGGGKEEGYYTSFKHHSHCGSAVVYGQLRSLPPDLGLQLTKHTQAHIYNLLWQLMVIKSNIRGSSASLSSLLQNRL